MRKTISIAIGVTILVVAALGVGSFVSQAKFGVSNPLATAGGLAQVILLDAEYVEVQGYPRVVIADSGASLEVE